MSIFLALILINSIAFLGYGISCLFSVKMKTEFIRFGLNSQQRIITGTAQVLGAVGLIVGSYTNLLISLAAAIGLCLLMLMGFIVRIKIKDPLSETLPSFIFMLLNLALAIAIQQRI